MLRCRRRRHNEEEEEEIGEARRPCLEAVLQHEIAMALRPLLQVVAAVAIEHLHAAKQRVHEVCHGQRKEDERKPHKRARVAAARRPLLLYCLCWSQLPALSKRASTR